MELSDATRTTAATLLLAIVAVEIGGLYVLGVVRGGMPRTPFQLAFARAGHAHAGVLVTLSLVVQLLADGTALGQPWASLARSGIPAAAILMPAGFFLSSAGTDRTRPNALIALVYVGAAVLGAGAVALGIGLLVAPAA
jgi:hypothetical protein